MTIAVCKRVVTGKGNCPHPTNCHCWPELTDEQRRKIEATRIGRIEFASAGAKRQK